jgi:mannose-6-phosphate isomerase-like protein (cupin superfamily)
MRLHNIHETVINQDKGFHTNIEKATVENDDYRRVLFTSGKSQLVVMSLKPGEEIGEETHKGDQFIRVDAGKGEVKIGNVITGFNDGDAVVIPAGVVHNVTNIGKEPLKLYAVYTPPEHEPDTVHKTKADE